MLRNDYRRSLIMLRSLEGSRSGHIRLERRTLMGSMQFTVFGTGRTDRLLALMIGSRNGRMQAHPLGEMRNGGRGQAGLHCEFDPRDMGGLTLEQYELAAVALWTGGGWSLVMAGFPNGSREIQWDAARQAASALLTPQIADAGSQIPVPPSESPADTIPADISPADISPADPSPADIFPADAAPEEDPSVEKAEILPESGNPASESAAEKAAAPERVSSLPLQSEPAPEKGEDPGILPPAMETAPRDPEEEPAAVMPPEIALPEAAPTPENEAQADLLAHSTYPEWSDPDGTDTPAGSVGDEPGAFSPAPGVFSRDPMDQPAGEEKIPSALLPEEEEPPDPDLFDIPAREEDLFDLPAPDLAPEPGPGDELTIPAPETVPSQDPASVVLDASAGSEDPFSPPREENGSQASSEKSALDRLALEEDIPWPESVEPLRSLFADSPPWPQPPDPDFVFVCTPMPEGCGWPYTLVGLRSEQGRILRVMYAVPGVYSPEPPPGLEDYLWQDGFWICCRPAGP